MEKRKFYPVHRLRRGRSDEQGFWFKDGGPPAIYLAEEGTGHFDYPDLATMRREGWIDNAPGVLYRP